MQQRRTPCTDTDITYFNIKVIKAPLVLQPNVDLEKLLAMTKSKATRSKRGNSSKYGVIKNSLCT
jgi:hypothetical protein